MNERLAKRIAAAQGRLDAIVPAPALVLAFRDDDGPWRDREGRLVDPDALEAEGAEVLKITVVHPTEDAR